jgi:hypothetical protein
MPLPQRPPRPTGTVERVHVDQLAVTRTPPSPKPLTRTPTRPRPTPAGWERRREQQRRAELLDTALALHRRITVATCGAEGDARRHLRRAAKSASKAINLLFTQLEKR